MKRSKKRIIQIIAFVLLCALFFVIMPNSNAYAAVKDGDNAINQKESTLKKQMENDLKKSKDDGSGIKKIEKGKGKFYKAYKKEIEEWKSSREKFSGEGSADSDIDLLKDFDYVRGSFDCGWIDVTCHITNVSYGATSTIINWTMIPFSTIVMKPSDVLNNEILNSYKGAFNALTKSLLCLFFIYQLFKLLIMRMTDIQSATQEGNEKVVTFIVAAFLVFTYDGLFRGIMNIQYVINYPLLYGLSATENIGKQISFNMFFMGSINMTVVFLAVVAVLIVVLILQMYYSLALISVMYVTGPVAVTTMLNSEYNFFSVWLKILVSRLLTLGLQALCIVLGIRMFARLSFDPVTTLTNSFTGIAFFIVAITIPSLLGQFGNSSGSGRAVLGGMKTATRYLIVKR
ncbi:hypothetical protein LSG23_20540 (plasmid) [Bacillus velezensis]|uniref:conjugal transfer protein TrbL family protein n=1 Tax=Bacillus velezensis TaxID=492670 RepID=UPI000988158D|nr:conjugal transfer protein TrbL family protein [Bacillus velezensis]AQS42494.1 hypothetical protein BVH55_00430 [Bacillus velezensis]WNR83202.1 hypothetical protein RP314_20790 [Bacillus velezensis]